MKNNQKTHKKSDRGDQKRKEEKEIVKWRLSMEQVLRGACLINGDGP